MKRGLLAIIAISLFASCADDRSASVADIVSQWEGREILFPENSVFTIQGRDTVDFQFQNAPYKILTYVDSVGCMSCKLHLAIWNHFIQRLDSLAGGKVPVVMYLHSKDLEELSFIAERDRFHHPVCFDEHDVLNGLNHFPQTMLYQTFLLDSDNKVVMVGNPILDTGIRDSLLGRLGIGDGQKLLETAFAVNASEVDLGRIPKDEITELKFTLTNLGDYVLKVKDVIPSCDCIQVEYPDVLTFPKDSIELVVRLHPEELGEFNKTVSVYANSVESPMELVLYGIVE